MLDTMLALVHNETTLGATPIKSVEIAIFKVHDR